MNKTKLLKWAKAAGVRALKTMAQTALSLITLGTAFLAIDWVAVVTISATAGVYSILTSITGLPEVEEN